MLSDDRSDAPEGGASEAVNETEGSAPAASASAADSAADSGVGRDEHLVSQLEIVESQPLADRAAAYEAIHEDLARRLEHDPAMPG